MAATRRHLTRPVVYSVGISSVESSMNTRPPEFANPTRNALAAGVAETGGGILFAAGLAMPFAAAALSSVMLTALRTVFWQDGIRLGKGGYELLLLASAIALAEEGPGRLSLDAVLGQERRGILLAAAALAGAGVGSTLAIETGRRYAAASPAEDQELARSAAATVEPSRS